MISLQSLACTAGEFRLRDVTLDIRKGEYFVLLGRPGSGKTVLLECIAGLRRLQSGQVHVGGRRVDHLAPGDRGIGYVPQDYALFSRMTVAGNMGFALRVRGCRAAQRAARTAELAALLGIGHLLPRSVAGLSGGERQRVALARALAALPQVLLLDEPVNSLDPETRDDILAELKRVQRETGTTLVHVCHDLEDMRAVADRLAVLDDGEAVQIGTPSDLAEWPRAPIVARILRLGAVVAAEATPEAGGSTVVLGPFRVLVPRHASGAVLVLVRADRIVVGDGAHTAVVRGVLPGPSVTRVELDLHGVLLRADVPTRSQASLRLLPGEGVRVAIPEDALWVFPHHSS